MQTEREGKAMITSISGTFEVAYINKEFFEKLFSPCKLINCPNHPTCIKKNLKCEISEEV